MCESVGAISFYFSMQSVKEDRVTLDPGGSLAGMRSDGAKGWAGKAATPGARAKRALLPAVP